MIKNTKKRMNFFASKRFFFLVAAIVGLILIHGITFGAAPFYEGKTIRIIVPFSAGGGYDTYARVFSRHMGKYIPGKPTLTVENMPGAGGLIGVNYLYKVAKPDGLTIGIWDGDGAIFLQLMGQPGVEFDARKFGYIGAPAIEDSACVFTKASGITSVEKWMASKTPVKMGGTAPGSSMDNDMRMLKTTLGFPIQIIDGYPGTAEVRLGIESGELAGSCWDWHSLKFILRTGLERGDLVAVLQIVPKPLPELPNVPLAIDFAKTDEARRLIEVGRHDPRLLDRVFGTPPGTPKELVQFLRKSFQETLRDKEFLAEVEKAKLTLIPVTAEEIEKAVERIFNLDPAMVAKLKEILFK